MSVLLIFFILLALISLVPIGIKRILFSKLQLKKSKLNWLVNGLTFLAFGILLSAIILSYYNWYYRGYKTTTFILITTAFLFVVNYLTTRFQHKIYQILVEIIIFFTIFSTCFISYVNLSGYNSNCLFSDSKYRIESFRFLMSKADYLPDIYIKNGVMERKYSLQYLNNYKFDYNHYLKKESITAYSVAQSENGLTVTFTFNDGTKLVTKTNSSINE